MLLERWDPTRELRTMRDFMARFFDAPLLSLAGEVTGAVDLEETDDAYILSVSVPGLKAKDIEVSFHGNTVCVRGRRREEKETRARNFIYRERREGNLARTVTLPGPVDADRAQAKIEDGVLVVKLPKSKETAGKVIPIED